MGQWVKLGQFRMFILRRVLKALACEFRPKSEEGGPSEQNLYTIMDIEQIHTVGGASTTLLQPRILSFSLLEDRDVGVGVLPESEKVLIGSARFGERVGL